METEPTIFRDKPELQGKLTKIIFIADIVGQPGLTVLSSFLPRTIRKYRPDLVIANGENGDNGRGITEELVRAYTGLGVNVITTGNHVWDKAQIRRKLKGIPHLLRPLNYPPGSGGHGSVITETNSGIKIAVVNLQGRTFLPPIDCPFRTMDRFLNNLSDSVQVIFVDFHAETTAEKIALGYYLDGRVSAVVGTHTHVQTADEKILPNGTGYLTDAGMTGPFHSVIGMDTQASIRRFLTQTPQKFIVAEDNLRINGAYLEIDSGTSKCLHIERLDLP